MIVFTADCDRDLKREEAAAASMAMLAVAGKKTQEATAEKKKMKEAAASESGDAAAHKEGDSLFKEGEMLRLREEFCEAQTLWREKLVPGALDRWLKRKKTTEETEQVPCCNKKRKKVVVRVMLPDDYIGYIEENPDVMRELSDEEMAQCPERFHQKHAIIKLMNARSRAYQQALIDQYRAFGFAYDEKEVTDDDEAVVKN